MRRTVGRRLRGARGQALVEFALVVPILLILVLGILEFGRAWNAYQVVTDAAREGARNAVVANPDMTRDSVVTLIENAIARSGYDPASATIDLDGWREGRGTPLRVTIDYPYDFVWLEPFMGWSVDQGTAELTSTFVMRNE